MNYIGHKYGLRTVAVFEALKAIATLMLCIALLSLLHKDLDLLVDRLTDWLRLNPDSRVIDWLYELSERASGKNIWRAVGIGIVYAIGRLIEAYGLWRERSWGEWFAVIAGAAYIPLEIVAIVAHPHWTRVAVLAGNIVIVLYILHILIQTRRARCAEVECLLVPKRQPNAERPTEPERREFIRR